MRPLCADEVRLVCAPDEIGDAALLAHYATLLAADERARCRRLRSEGDRRRFLIARALVRSVLSAHTGVAPEDLVFVPGRWGKPAIAHPPGARLAFNLAHTRGAVLCAVARAQAVGVDIEHVGDRHDGYEIAARHFAAREVEALAALPDRTRDDRFFDYWTLKEAYAKGRGMGLSLPFDRFAVDLHPPAGASVSVAPDFDDGRQWQLRRLALSPRHRAAAAVCLSPTGRAFRFTVERIVPFGARSDLPRRTGLLHQAMD